MLELRNGRWKFHPLVDWSDRDVWQYLQAHDLPYHPLWDKGYVSIGDWHSTKALHEVEAELAAGSERVVIPLRGALRMMGAEAPVA